MVKPLVCCRNQEGISNTESPFTMIALEYYDGPTSGILQCQVCWSVYKFVMVDWDDFQDVRIHSLALLPSEAFNQVVSVFSNYELPKWPIWIPLWQFPSGTDQELAEEEIKKALSKADAPSLVVALSQWGDTILAMRRLAGIELESINDWFSFMGLIRRTTDPES